ncbi:hypothetical protein K443DRAFT_476953 [Laccaria amethystina LaAM-08-1]|uniref:Unplaced genomic scaffold K443scaffold_45, whole genome shotgun sequence n=1 Tax=Laccaria amethystina LaAM-08-1 TaxID=1095629 RepID=A0A0C9XEY4_9AGAR|nr:hypothetical protein K443DRAFT_476953 [Laccaria amethystina LaAM-08-1]
MQKKLLHITFSAVMTAPGLNPVPSGLHACDILSFGITKSLDSSTRPPSERYRRSQFICVHMCPYVRHSTRTSD